MRHGKEISHLIQNLLLNTEVLNILAHSLLTTTMILLCGYNIFTFLSGQRQRVFQQQYFVQFVHRHSTKCGSLHPSFNFGSKSYTSMVPSHCNNQQTTNALVASIHNLNHLLCIEVFTVASNTNNDFSISFCHHLVVSGNLPSPPSADSEVLTNVNPTFSLLAAVVNHHFSWRKPAQCLWVCHDRRLCLHHRLISLHSI